MIERRGRAQSRNENGATSSEIAPFRVDHDAIEWNRIMISSSRLSMIFSENRSPLFRIML